MLASLAGAFLLGACSQGVAPTGPYAKWLQKNESAQAVTRAGPFTILDVTWFEHGSSFMGSTLPDRYQRVVWRDKVLVQKARLLERWDTGNGRTMLVVLANKEGSKFERTLLIVDERPDGTVLHRPRSTDPDWSEDPNYSIGTPVDRRTRHFGITDGSFNFLLDLETLAVTKIPKGVGNWAVPHVTEYAGMAPDGTAVAYASGDVDPSALVVVDLAGGRRDVIPIPQAILAKDPEKDLSHFSPLLRWFAANRVWRKNSAGQWDTQPVAVPRAAANPVEELYLDADSGYRTCFVAANDACARGWRNAGDKDNAALPELHGHSHAYVPEQPVRAFGANVAALWLRPAVVENGYTLLSDASPEHLARELAARLAQRRVPFVDTTQCPGIRSGTRECMALLTRTFGWEGQLAPYIEGAIQPGDGAAAVIVTPTAILAISPRGTGSYLVTMARYARSGPLWRVY